MSQRDDQDASSKHESSSEAASDEDTGQPVELMVTARVKRATAGNRLSSLLDKEARDDIDLLFAENEEEEDVEFEEEEEEEEDGDGSEAELESSSNEEDAGPANGEDDLTGERELQKQDRLERKKRKAQDVFNNPGALRKRVRVDPTATLAPGAPPTPAPRPKKKSERVSWVPAPADAPTRISSRKQTVKNREVVHKRLVDSEQQRIKIMKQMEAAQKRKDAHQVKPMTQAERLDEAAKIERKNAKSLNRWEEAERKRSEEQKARLEALHNRQLTGPVISIWSGIARFINGKVFQIGVREIRGAGHKEQSNLTVTNRLDLIAQHDQANASHSNIQEKSIYEPSQENQHLELSAPLGGPCGYSAQRTSQASPEQGSSGFLDGIHAYAALPAQIKQPEFTGTADDAIRAPSLPLPIANAQTPFGQTTQAPAARKSIVAVDEYSSRNLVALRNIDVNATRMSELRENVLLKKQKAKLQKPIPVFCAITSQPAKFRDPKTGLAYASTYAYKEIQRLHSGGSRWSNLLDCYVGSATIVARGVLDRFFKKP